MIMKKKIRLARGEIKQGKRAKGQRAIQESWGGNSQDENQNSVDVRHDREKSGSGTQSDTT
jgi:hypothetical protein